MARINVIVKNICLLYWILCKLTFVIIGLDKKRPQSVKMGTTTTHDYVNMFTVVHQQLRLCTAEQDEQ